MNRIILIALFCGIFQFAASNQLNCDKSDLTTCKREVSRYFDREFKIAHLTSLTRFVHRYIDVCRDLIKQYEQDKDYVDTLHKTVRNLKTELEHIHEKWNDTEELLKIMNRLRDLLRRDTLRPRNITNADEELNRVLENRQFKQNFNEALRLMIAEITWHLREINEELRYKEIQIEDLTVDIDELVRYVKSTKNNDTLDRLKRFIEMLGNVTAKLDLPYAKNANLERIEQIKKEWE